MSKVMAVYSSLIWGRNSLPSVMKYLRHCSPECLQEFYDEFMKTSGSLVSLRKLYQLLHNHHSRCLPDDVAIAVVATLCDKSLPLAVRQICLYVLLESLPNDAIQLQDLEQSGAMTDISPNLMELFTVVQTEKVSREALHLFRTKLIRCIASEHDAIVDVKSRALQVLVQLVRLSDAPFPRDEAESLAQSLKSFLGSRTVVRPPAPIKRRESLVGTMEIDGVPASQFTTILNLVESPSGNDFLNIQTFSALHQLWPSVIGKSCHSPVEQELARKTVEYCLRVLEQVEWTPLKPLDANFQQAALIESLVLLSDACQSDSTQVARVIPAVRRVHDRTSIPEVVLPALRFLLVQGKHVAYDPADELENFFTRIIVKATKNLCSSCEVILFLTAHLEEFNSIPALLLQSWFPNILKILAWFPVTFISDFMDLLPTFMSLTTTIEVLHSVLDLPCLTAAMLCTGDEELHSRSNILPNLLSPNCKAMLKFILRQKSGSGETLDGLHLLHSSLQDLKDHPRVQAAASAVPPLLKVYFEVIADNADAAVASRLLPVMLERSSTLYPIPGYSEDVQRIFSEEILQIFQKHPRLISEAKHEISDFFCSVKDPSQSLCTNLIWAIGQYTWSTFNADCTLELVHNYYDILECMTYEHLSRSKPRTISIIAATLVKLASRNQDLVPRVLLCLSKVDHFTKTTGMAEWTMVASRLEEFRALLAEPNVAFTILSPLPEVLSSRYNRDSATLPVLWRAASALVCNSSLASKHPDQDA